MREVPSSRRPVIRIAGFWLGCVLWAAFADSVRGIGDSGAFEHFQYRVPLKVNSGSARYQDKVVEFKIDLQSLLAQVHTSAKRLNASSIRMAEVDGEGNLLNSCSAQYDADTLYWKMSGETPVGATRYYSVYFNTTDRSGIDLPPMEKPEVVRDDLPGRWSFNTPGGYYVFERSGGAFEVFSPAPCEDNESGKDWMRDDFQAYNGILNIGDPDTHAIFHPNEDPEANEGIWKGCKSVIIFDGPLHTRIRSINRFEEIPGDYRSNTTYTVFFDIFPHFVRATMATGNADGYACIMEMTPGGDQLEDTDYVIRSDGKKFLRGETCSEDIDREWLVAGDADDPHQIFFWHPEDDDVKDGINWYDFMQAVMIGWGRGANPGIHQYPNSFYFGFSQLGGKEPEEIDAWLRQLSSQPEIEVGRVAVRELDDWGRIRISEIDGKLEVELENSRILCRYTPVITANLETAITRLELKSTGQNLAGKHLDEMARGGGDRGVLAEGTSIVREDASRKTVRLVWDDGGSVEEVTIFPDKPYLKIDYMSTYINICDIGNDSIFADGEHYVYGAEAWKAKRTELLNAGAEVDENTHHALSDGLYPEYPFPLLNDWDVPASENPMNREGWYVVGVRSPKNNVGYGRVIPADDVDHLKLLWKVGFEQFPFWKEKSSKRPFTEYLFVVDSGDVDAMAAAGDEIVTFANRQRAQWYTVDAANQTLSNQWLEVGYGDDRIVEGQRMTGIHRFVDRRSGVNLALSLDAMGCDYAQYHSGGPSRYAITHTGDDYVEATVTLSSEDNGCVDVVKRDRLFRGVPVLEIEYSQLDILWWEDFYRSDRPGDLRYVIHGVNQEIDAETRTAWQAVAEAECQHNFGDCFLEAAGLDVEQSVYKGCFIFGSYDAETGMGIGFVTPASVGLHDGFKLWSMYNYECFPFYGRESELPLKRWIFSTSEGREGILRMGKAIAETHHSGRNLRSAIPELRKALFPVEVK